METIVSVQNLVKRYKDLIALDHFSLEIQEGEVLGLLGPNGSGKTTAINCMLALLTIDKGDITLFGQKMTPTSYAIKQQIGMVPQQVAVFGELTVQENIDYFCGLYIAEKAKRRQLVEEAIAFVGLEDFRKFLPRKLSGGLLRRLNIACGVAHKPRLIILDEPTVAVDPQSRAHILAGIQQLNRQGATVIYTSHYMEEVEQICTRIVIMDAGRSLAEGTSESLKQMIKVGETVRIELAGISGEDMEVLKGIPRVYEVTFEDGQLTVRSRPGGQNLLRVLDILQQKEIPFSRVYSDQPTLNDVFLEITGRQLRDGGEAE
ncbi:MAG: ABC transporter ATP-binding protein [Ruminococcaceae bacterium]|nr:ABC transporter ATP-binding protein [Oscillospiraceae bacterium]